MAAARKQIETDSSGGAGERRILGEVTRVSIDGRDRDMTVVVATTPREIAGHVAAWESLVESAIEPNVFYEPWMLIPAVNHLRGRDDPRFVFIYTADAARPAGPPLLCGLFPLARARRGLGLVNSLRTWKHLHCFLCTPLVRDGYAEECLEAFFEWLTRKPFGCSLMEFGSVAGDGAFHRLLVDYFFRHGAMNFVADRHTRALFRPAEDAESFLRSSLGGARRKKLARALKKLAASGRTEFSTLEESGNLEAWMEELMRLEASGWKGRSGTAISCNESEQRFFTEISEAAYRRGSLRAIELRLDGRPIALEWYFVTRNGSFAFKTAFDERFSNYSPGVLLQIERVRRLHAVPDVEWMDSCAVSDSHLNHLWRDRRVIESIVVGAGGKSGDFLIAMMPLLRWVARKMRVNRVSSRRGKSK